jgi:hypothetical protein
MKYLNIKLAFISALFIASSMSQLVRAQSDSTQAEEDVLFENKKVKVTMTKKRLMEDSTQREERRIVIEDEDGEKEEIIIRDKNTVVITDEDKEVVLLGVEEPDDKPDKPKFIEVDGMSFDIGINNWLTRDNSFDIEAPYSDMRANNVRSINLGWQILTAGLNVSKEKLWLITGVGIEYNNYRFDNDIDLNRNEDQLVVTNSDLNYSKNKLVSQYLSVPLGVHFKSNPDEDDESFDIEAGVQLGYLIGSHQKQKWDDGNTQKRKLRGDYQFQDTRLGYYARIGFGNFNLYAKYYPGSAFKDARGPEVSTVCAGLTINAF